MYAALHGVGAPTARMNSYGWRDLDRKPTTKNFDAAMGDLLDDVKKVTTPAAP